MGTESHLAIWTIYLRPQNSPEVYVAHKALVGKGRVIPTGETLAAETLEDLRALLPFGLVLFCRSESDAPDIVESWL
ncbi:hypothetical protein D3C84_380420 [compost metagenome]